MFVLFLLIGSVDILIGCDSRPPAPPPPPRIDAGLVRRDVGPPGEDAGNDASIMDAEIGDDAETSLDGGIMFDAGAPDVWDPCSTGADMDADGDRSLACGGTDCDDLNPARSGILEELCGNLVDEDCSGAPDDALDTFICDLQILCRNTDCFCYPGCPLTLCLERLRGGYIDFHHCSNPEDVAAAYVMDCAGMTVACSDLISCIGNVLITSPDLCMCAPGFPSCSGLCTDIQNDPYSCGTCGNACRIREVCTAAACVHCGRDGESCCYGDPSMTCDPGLSCDSAFICRP
ncbi:MAG: hypothetical protein AAB668_02830 [Patescibacteria group bacterium]